MINHTIKTVVITSVITFLITGITLNKINQDTALNVFFNKVQSALFLSQVISTPTPISSITPTPIPMPTPTPMPTPIPNLIHNSSLENDTDNNKIPDSWIKSKWGSNKATFTYPVAGLRDSKAANIKITSYITGDAKWYFKDIPTTPGHKYRFRDYYIANATTRLVAQYTKTNGKYIYTELATLPVAADWQLTTVIINPPTGTVATAILHLISKKGSLTVDEYSFTDEGIPTTPTPTPTPSPSPIESGSPTLTPATRPVSTTILNPTLDTAPPLVNSFDVQSRTTTTGQSVTASFTVTDTGGSFLKNVSFNRAPYSTTGCNEINRTNCVWTTTKTADTPTKSNSWTSKLQDNPTTGTWWYGLAVFDSAGKIAYEAASIKVTVNASGASASSALKESSDLISTVIPTLTPVLTPSNSSGQASSPQSTSTPTPSIPTPTPTSAPSPTPTPSKTPTPTPSPSTTPTPTPSTSSGPTPSASATPIPTPTPTPVVGLDTAAPKVNSFDVQPRTINSGQSITASFNVTDAGGSFLKSVGLNRAPYNAIGCNETNRTSCAWTGPKTANTPANINFWTSTLQDNPTTGTWWYGLAVFDGTGKVAYEATTIKVIVNASITTPTPSATPNPTATPIPTSSPTPSPTPTPTSTSAPTPTPSLTPTPTSTPTPIPTPIPTLAPTPTPTPMPITSPGGMLWGAYTGNNTSSLATFESLVGKSVNISAIFTGWGSSGPFPSEHKATVANQGKTLLIFWESIGTTLDAIISGSQDSYMQQFANSAKAYGGPIILAPFHEMNGDWTPWSGSAAGNSPAKIISAWKRMHDIFVAANATNVKFGWAVNNDDWPNTTANRFENYYPGDAYVDIIGVDGFNFNNPWEDWNGVFSTSLNRIAAVTPNKPIYIFSTGSAEGAQKAAWITTGFGINIKAYPRVAGWVWFNANKERDWRINSDTASLDAFKAILP